MNKAYLRGKLLVASPHLDDPNFYHTVVFVVLHNDEGAIGLVLNRPTSATLEDALELLSDDSPAPSPGWSIGGPVEGPLMALHADQLCREEEETLIDGVYFSLSPKNLQFLAQQSVAPSRFFKGYAGWAEGQLEDELQTGSWLVGDATLDDLFGSTWDLWDRVLRRIGFSILSDALGGIERPTDPSCN